MRFSCYIQILTAFALLPFANLGAIDFTRDIQPILKDHCYKCHSGPKAKRKIRYDNLKYFKEVIGTHEAAVVIPGDPENSKMYKLSSLPQSSTDAMPPPRRGIPLNSAEKALIRKWIAEGASFESKPDSSSSPDPNKIHTWINTEGKSLKAAFVSASSSAVKLRKEDGAEFSYPLDKLSKESQDLAKALSE